MVIRNEPIIAVKNVEASSKWYQKLLGCKSKHGGSAFEILVDDEKTVLLCLHTWGEHGHPTMMNAGITPRNGLILYFRVDDLQSIWNNAISLNAKIEEEIHLNTNSEKEEFSLRDLDGYYLTITKYHEYEG